MGQNGAQGGRKWSTGLNGLCSLQGRQECLPYLMPVAIYATLGEMLQGEASKVKTGIYYETKPTSLLDST